jgi:methionine-rich copper-binding protein CopC
MNPRPLDGRRRGGLVAVVVALLLALPAGVAAHAELETVSPADGATVTEMPTEIVMTFTEPLDPTKSSIVLAEVGNPPVLSGGEVSPTDPKKMTLPIAELAAGAYEVRWTSASAADGDIERGTTHFTYSPPPPSPTDEPSAPTSPSPTPSASPAPSPSASPLPSPSASTGPASASGGDVLLPILAALLVVGVLGAVLLRGRSRGGGPA